MNCKKIGDRILADVRAVVPGVSVRSKTSWIWRILPGRFRNSGLAFGRTIWLPELHELSDESRARSRLLFLAHELTHVLDRHRQGLVYNVKYALPNAFVLMCAEVALGAAALWFHFALGVWGIFAALMLGTVLIPCPSPWRLAVERLAYSTSVYVMSRYFKIPRTWIEEDLKDCLSDPIYLGMVSKHDAAIEAAVMTSTIWLGDFSIVDEEMKAILDRAFKGDEA
jgi:hypothetical protein